MNRTCRYAVFAVCALRLINNRQEIVQHQRIDRTKCNTRSTTETAIVINDEEFRGVSRHGTAKRGDVSIFPPHPLSFLSRMKNHE
jgi:hypothetical protein